MIKKNQILDLSIEKLAFGGKGIARIDNFVVFVRSALPGQTVRAKIIRKKSAFAEAIVLEILKRSPLQIDAPCPYFGDCGGCKLQNMDYDAQCRIKTEQVRETFSHLVSLQNVPVLQALPAPGIFGYRNKMDFSAGDVRWIMRENDPETPRDFAIGLHAPGRFDRILDIDACLLQSDKMNKIFGTVRKWAKEYKIPLNNPKNYTGFLRSCMIRQGYHSGEIMVNIVTRKEDPNLLQPLIDMLTEWHPDITSCVNNITDSKGDISRGDREILLFGDSVIHDRIGDLNYEISANAFFQTNTRAAEILYSTIADFADLNSSCVIWDLYCGTGSIAMYLSKHVKKVYGFELVAGAVRNATRNAAANKIENCEFYEANLDKFVQNNAALIASLDKPDIAIVDPPRSGLNPKFLNQLVQLKPRQIIYVSCNPASQARDLDILSDDYNVLKIQPVDMFPHTPHIETVAKLELIK